MTVRLGNVYIGNRTRWRAVRRLLHGRPDVVVINEGGRVARGLGVRRPGYRVARARSGDLRGRTDVLVLTRRDIPLIRSYSVRISKGMTTIASNHDRHMVVSLLRHPVVGRLAVIGIHPSPAPAALRGNGDSGLARQYAAALARVAVEVETLRAAGYAVVVAGDVQIPQGKAGTPDCDPYAVMASAGLTLVVAEHLDAIWSDVPMCGHVTYRAHSPLTGSDHPFLSARKSKG